MEAETWQQGRVEALKEAMSWCQGRHASADEEPFG